MSVDDERVADIRKASNKTKISESCQDTEPILLDSPTERLRAYLRSGKAPATDDLDVYNSDYRTFAPLGDVETADMRHQRECRNTTEAADTADRPDSIAGAAAVAVESQTTEPAHSPDRFYEASEQLESPGFITLKADRCGHRHAGSLACRRCIDACEYQAIDTGDPLPRIDHPACRGCANCVTACPIGAFQLTNPMTEPALDQITAEMAGCLSAPIVVFHENWPELTSAGDTRDPDIIELLFEPIGALGLETLLATLAAGAAGILIIPGKETGGRTLDLLREQVQWSRLMAQGLGFHDKAVALLEPGTETFRLPEPIPDSCPPPEPVSVPSDQPKRRLTRWAIRQLATRSRTEEKIFELPAGAPYGEVILDCKTCTLCMACTSACPTGALSTAGETTPGLLFKEAECAQCGLCATGCPENSLQLHARMHVSAHLEETTRSLKEEMPFLCTRCGTPFATKTMIEAITARLSGHWLFGTPAEKERLQMCRTCRVKAMFETPEEESASR